MEKASDKLIGVTGLISEQADDENYVEVGYIYQKSYWGNGYVFEAACACVDYVCWVDRFAKRDRRTERIRDKMIIREMAIEDIPQLANLYKQFWNEESCLVRAPFYTAGIYWKKNWLRTDLICKSGMQEEEYKSGYDFF